MLSRGFKLQVKSEAKGIERLAYRVIAAVLQWARVFAFVTEARGDCAVLSASTTVRFGSHQRRDA